MAELAYRESLVKAGLDKSQASIYEAMVKIGPSPASDIARAAGIGRPLSYKVLEELIALGLAEKKEKPGKVAPTMSRFAPSFVAEKRNGTRNAGSEYFHACIIEPKGFPPVMAAAAQGERPTGGETSERTAK